MMGFFKNLNVFHKQLLATVTSSVVLLSVIAIAVLNAMEMESASRQMAQRFLPNANDISDINDAYWMRRLRASALVYATQPQERTDLRKGIKESDEAMDQTLASYRKRVAGESEQTLFQNLESFIERDRADIAQLVALSGAGDPAKAVAWEHHKSRPLYLSSDQYFDALKQHNSQQVADQEAAMHRHTETFKVAFPLVCLVAIGLMALIGWWIATSISRPIQAITKTAQKISAGDLSGTVERLDSRDEIGQLSHALADMSKSLRSLMTQIKRQVSTVTASSCDMQQTASQIDIMSDNLRSASDSTNVLTERLGGDIHTVADAVVMASDNVREVGRSCEQVEQSGRDVGQSAEQLAVNMREMSQAAEQMSGSVHTIASAMEQMSASLNEVAGNAAQAAQVTNDAEQRAAATRQSVNALGESAQEIGNVLGLIRTIASQTNLLALNASIEAASAGEAGKGFAVVASEVKELAKQSEQATDVIRQRIEDMQNSTHAAIAEIASITETITQINNISESIATAIDQQAATVQEVGRSVVGVAAAAQQVAGNVSGSAQLAGNVAEKADKTLMAVDSISQNLISLTTRTQTIEEKMQGASVCSQEMERGMAQVRQVSQESAQRSSDVKKDADALSSLSAELTELINAFNVCEPYIVWTNDYAVGIPSIDNQHQYLFRLINQLNEAVQTESSGAVMGNLLEGLINYTVSHFDNEEAMMQQTDYPDARAHIEQHERFKAQVVGFYEQFKAGTAVVDDAVLNMLTQWLKGHVMGSDFQYRDHFKERGMR
ncbi:MAG: bacteriohemerythrin [Vampirovibrionales bacterium]|nr:bacteriohemerythrin [Vampirovibrionales bacterium]